MVHTRSARASSTSARAFDSDDLPVEYHSSAVHGAVQPGQLRERARHVGTIGRLVDVRHRNRVYDAAAQFELTRQVCNEIGWQYEAFIGTRSWNTMCDGWPGTGRTDSHRLIGPRCDHRLLRRPAAVGRRCTSHQQIDRRAEAHGLVSGLAAPLRRRTGPGSVPKKPSNRVSSSRRVVGEQNK